MRARASSLYYVRVLTVVYLLSCTYCRVRTCTYCRAYVRVLTVVYFYPIKNRRGEGSPKIGNDSDSIHPINKFFGLESTPSRLGGHMHNPYQQQRLAMIDAVLNQYGSIGRKVLVRTFGISMPQATRDLATYTELAPANTRYCSASKLHFKTSDFHPIYSVEGEID